MTLATSEEQIRNLVDHSWVLKMSTELRIIALEARIAVLESLLTNSERTTAATTATPSIDPDTLFTAQEAAERLRCGKTNVYDLWESGELAVTNTGAGKKGKRVRGSDLIAFLDSRKEGGPQPKSRFKHLKSLN